jgi:hydrogenase/urease accessory protein HupE
VKTRAALVLLCAGLWPALAAAHQVGVSRSVWTSQSARVTGALTLANSELNALNAGALEKAVGEDVAVSGCTRIESASKVVEADGVEVMLTFDCPGTSRREVDLSKLLERLGPEHRHLAEFGGGETVLRAAAPRFTLGAAAAKSTSTADIIVMGVTHILEGADHLLFLLGLILGVRRLRSVIGVATSFTVGHSISLSIATLGLFVPPSRVVEPLVALSLVWVGVENILREPKGRWRVAGAFGLVHGFAFASALTDLGLPREQIGWALFGFNFGVELGQLAVLIPLVPLLQLARKKEVFERLGTKILSGGVALAGAVWFVIRVAGL